MSRNLPEIFFQKYREVRDASKEDSDQIQQDFQNVLNVPNLLGLSLDFLGVRDIGKFVLFGNIPLDGENFSIC